MLVSSILMFVATLGVAPQERPPATLSASDRLAQASVAAFHRLPGIPCRYRLTSTVYMLPLANMGPFESFAPAISKLRDLTGDIGDDVIPEITRQVREAIAETGDVMGEPATLGAITPSRGSLECLVAQSESVVRSSSVLQPGIVQTHLRFSDREVTYRPDMNLIWQSEVPSTSLNAMPDLLYPLGLAPSVAPVFRHSDKNTTISWTEEGYYLNLLVSQKGRSWLVTGGVVVAKGTTALTMIEYAVNAGGVAPRVILQLNLQTAAPARCEIRLHTITEFSYGANLADLRLTIPRGVRFGDGLNMVPQKTLPSELSSWVIVQ
jgi:hypothetical protein